ncbi:MAG: hypothetical protein PHI63_02235 [Patescibacteria group bacterium]|nr:hypothetical protein [Patescibacteria group bacterium]
MRDRPSDFIACLNPRLSVSLPGVRVEFDDAGNPTATLDEEFVAANCECSSCENNPGDDGVCGNEW